MGTAQVHITPIGRQYKIAIFMPGGEQLLDAADVVVLDDTKIVSVNELVNAYHRLESLRNALERVIDR